MGQGQANAGDYVHRIEHVDFLDKIEFDSALNVVPEPTTLLLVGTGLLGAIGYVRRRRMS